MPHYRYQCASCGVGLTEELVFEASGRDLCPHCFDGEGRDGTTGTTWIDVGIPVE